MKKNTLFLILFITIIYTINAQNIGDKVYKELTIDNKTVYKWCELYSTKEYNEQGKETRYTSSVVDRINTYDNNGNKTYTKELYFFSVPTVYETTYEYNQYGKLILEKSIKDGKKINEKYYEYDSNGNQIHTKSEDTEEWNDYDDKKNLIHTKMKSKIQNSTSKKETDIYYEYNDHGKLVYYKQIAYGYMIEYEGTYKWDDKDRILYRKELCYKNGEPQYFYEYNYEVNEKGVTIHEKDSIPYYNGKDKNDKEIHIQKPVDIKYVNIYKDNVVMRYAFKQEENNNETEITEAVFWENERKTLKSETIYKIK